MEKLDAHTTALSPKVVLTTSALAFVACGKYFPVS